MLKKGSFKLTKGLFKKSEVPFFEAKSLKSIAVMWATFVGFIIALKIAVLLIFGLDLLASLAVWTFFGGLIFSVLNRNGIHFIIGAAIALLCETVNPLLAGGFNV